MRELTVPPPLCPMANYTPEILHKYPLLLHTYKKYISHQLLTARKRKTIFVSCLTSIFFYDFLFKRTQHKEVIIVASIRPTVHSQEQVKEPEGCRCKKHESDRFSANISNFNQISNKLIDVLLHYEERVFPVRSNKFLRR